MIVGDLADQPVRLTADACDVGTPALDEVVDDLVVFVSIDRIDGPGRTLAFAGPCVLRDQGRGLPVVGTVTVDSADLSRLVTNGGAVDVVAHELGHVLGFGTVWRDLAGAPGGTPLVRDLTFPTSRFVGAGARAASAILGYSAEADGVPLETGGGGGTRDAHWAEARFGTELMTGFYNAGATNPLSLVTVRSLADLGYATTDLGADPTSVVETTPGAGPAFGLLRSVLAAPLTREAWDVVRTPVLGVGADGVVRPRR